MNDPLGWPVWRRGALLGLRWVAVFFAATVVIYAALGTVGWSGVGRALCAMAVGPILGTGVILLWWAVRHPSLAPTVADHAPTDDNPLGQGESEV
ncbi:MAG TPA: hypothetical protein VMT24_02260 [Aggregatilineaceae bacterium]|jgi:hypothetical protein|nr:hypothetical protein [Aggregatilineaceae bacterium]